MFKASRAIVLAAAVAATVQFASVAVAAPDPKADPKTGVIKMDTYLCKDLMRQDGDDRGVSLGLLHGYFLGKAGSTTYDPRRIGKITDDFLEYCLDHPADKAMDSFAKIFKENGGGVSGK
jgi:hypothetical protein